MAGPWRVPTDGRSDRVNGRCSSSHGLEPSLRDRVTKSACSRSDRRRSVAPRRPPMRFVAPPAHPPWRVHFPEPDPESVHAADALPCSDLPPGGDSSVSGRLRGPCPRPCPTTDESVAVEDGSASQESPSTRERPVCGGTTDDQRMRARLTERHRCTGRPLRDRDRGPGSSAEREPCVRPSEDGHPRGPPGGQQRPIASRPARAPPSSRRACSPRGAIAPSRLRDPVQLGPWGHPPGNRQLPSRTRWAEAHHDRRWGPEDRPRRSSGEDRRGARPDGAWLLVASFHTRFVPPAPFLTTWTGCPSPGLSGMFHPVTLVGFGFRWNDPAAGSRPSRPEGRAGRSALLVVAHAAGPRTALAILRPTRPWQARDATRVRPWRDSLRGPGPLPNAFTPDQVKRDRA